MEKKVYLGGRPMRIWSIIPELGWVSIVNKFGNGVPSEGNYYFLLVYDADGNKLDFCTTTLCTEIDGTSKYFVGAKKEGDAYKEAIFDAKTAERLSPWYYKKYCGVNSKRIFYTGNGHYAIVEEPEDRREKDITFYSLKDNKITASYKNKQFAFSYPRIVKNFINQGQHTYNISMVNKERQDYLSDKKTMIERYKNKNYQHSIIVNYKGECIICKNDDIESSGRSYSSPWDSTYLTIRNNTYHDLDSLHPSKSYLFTNTGEKINESIEQEGGIDLVQKNGLFLEFSYKYEVDIYSDSDEPVLKYGLNRVVDLQGNEYSTDEKFHYLFPFNHNTYKLLIPNNTKEHKTDYFNDELEPIAPILPKDIYIVDQYGSFCHVSAYNDREEKIYFLVDTLGTEIVPRNHHQEGTMVSRSGWRTEENAFGYVISASPIGGAISTIYNFEGEQITPKFSILFTSPFTRPYNLKEAHFLDLNEYVKNIKNNQGVIRAATTKTGKKAKLYYYMELRDGKAFHFKSDSILTEVTNKFEPFKVW
ncbi:hypothetical protein [Flammeovirga kamogawensis]|uniref:Uncharacterized protein n=2 Tax=Flammeovirga kamogawensis TaxID=373891 RepID=A0ABX8H2G8_9BACT|nr:hypothetical protein [Flammeovirga kamogawensis]QWG09859.1 hypothetical protein KM029_19455 [Flammeovirga kamogawensis]TRX65366.1 hypothetical protein EO216_22850 [Flammeovirga kamogawensis]